MRGGRADEIVGVGLRRRQRLLDDHVLAGLERLLREPVVELVRQLQGDGVDRGIGQQLREVGVGRRAVALALGLRARRVDVADRDEISRPSAAL